MGVSSGIDRPRHRHRRGRYGFGDLAEDRCDLGRRETKNVLRVVLLEGFNLAENRIVRRLLLRLLYKGVRDLAKLPTDLPTIDLFHVIGEFADALRERGDQDSSFLVGASPLIVGSCAGATG